MHPDLSSRTRRPQSLVPGGPYPMGRTPLARTLLFDVRDDEERRAALLEDGRLSLLWVEREDERSLVGNIYKGRVLRVEPAINAAFVDLGLDRPGFLPADDVQAALNGDAAPTDSMTGEPPEP